MFSARFCNPCKIQELRNPQSRIPGLENQSRIAVPTCQDYGLCGIKSTTTLANPSLWLQVAHSDLCPFKLVQNMLIVVNLQRIPRWSKFLFIGLNSRWYSFLALGIQKIIDALYMYSVPKTSQLLIFLITCQKLTNFNKFWYVKFWENLTWTTYRFVHLTCQM